MTGSVKILGIPALLGRFAAAEIASSVALVAGQRELSEDVAAVARTRVPVDTGRLLSSIENDENGVRTDVPYAGPVEYGTATTPAQPFMRPAADTVNGEAAAGTMKAIMDAV